MLLPLLQLATRLLATAPTGAQLQAALAFHDSVLASTASAIAAAGGQQPATALHTHHATSSPFSHQPPSGAGVLSQAASLAVLSVADELSKSAAHMRRAAGGSYEAQDQPPLLLPGGAESGIHPTALDGERAGAYITALLAAGSHLIDASGSPAHLAVRRQVLAVLASLLQPLSAPGIATANGGTEADAAARITAPTSTSGGAAADVLASLWLRVCEGVRTLLQEATAAAGVGGGRGGKAEWGRQALAALGPHCAALARTLLCGPGEAGAKTAGSPTQPAGQASVAAQTAAECIKVLLAGAGLVGAAHAAPSTAQQQQQEGVLRVLAALLVEAAAAVPGLPGLRDMAIKLAASLPSSAVLGMYLCCVVEGVEHLRLSSDGLAPGMLP